MIPLDLAAIEEVLSIDIADSRHQTAETVERAKWTLAILAAMRATETERDTLADALRASHEECARLRGLADSARERADVLIARAEDRASRLAALMLRVAARRDQLTSDLSVVTAQRDAAMAIISGSTTPPTDAEIAAHDGMWRCVTPRNQWDGMGPRMAAAMRDALAGEPCRWWALDSNRRPCAWPTTGGAP